MVRMETINIVGEANFQSVIVSSSDECAGSCVAEPLCEGSVYVPIW